MLITLINCTLTIKKIRTQQEEEIHEWNHNNYKKLQPLEKKGRKESKSPNKTKFSNALKITVRYCETCREQTLFINDKKYHHSSCEKCGKTHGSKGNLTKRINIALNPMRGTGQHKKR